MPLKGRRHIESIFADIDDAATAAAELVARGKAAWDMDRLLRLAGEAIIGRIADAAGRLPTRVRLEVSDVPWDDIRDIRILVDHIYHRIDYILEGSVLIPFLSRRRECERSHLGARRRASDEVDLFRGLRPHSDSEARAVCLR